MAEVLRFGSRKRIAAETSERRVALQRGEAHFEVHHDPARPFVVQAGGSSIEAVGTAFNVYLRDESKLEVLVTEGRVLISWPKARDALDSGISDPEVLGLTAGELATLAPSQHQIRATCIRAPTCAPTTRRSG